MLNKLISLVLIILIATLPAYAEPGKIADLSKGSKAPFTGVLMSEDLATKLYLGAKFSPKECELKIEERLSVEKLECKRKEDVLNSSLLIQKEKYESIISFKDNRIEFLEKKWTPSPWYETGEFWLSVGVVTGILITVASGYALGMASR